MNYLYKVKFTKMIRVNDREGKSEPGTKVTDE